MINKRIMMRICFVLEIIIYSWFYQYGVGGMVTIGKLQQENEAIECHIDAMKHEIEICSAELDAWVHDPFYKEKLAREQLHMARDGEEIYLL